MAAKLGDSTFEQEQTKFKMKIKNEKNPFLFAFTFAFTFIAQTTSQKLQKAYSSLNLIRN
jgi:hypothetical protein